MKHDVLILSRNENHAIPAEILEPAIKLYPRYLGCAYGDGEQVHVVRMQDGVKKFSMTLESIQGGDVKLKGKKVYYVFGNAEGKLENADIQPFNVLVNEKNQTLLVACMDGEFEESARKVLEDRLTKKIEKSFKYVDYDIHRLMEEELTDPEEGQRIINTILGERGAIVLISPDHKDTLTFLVAGDTSPREFDWGWISNATGIVEEEQEETDAFAAALDATLGTKDEAKSAPKSDSSVPPAHVPSGFVRPGSKKSASVPQIASTTPISGGGSKGSTPSAGAEQGDVKIAEQDYFHVNLPNKIRGDKKAKSNFLRKRWPDQLPIDWFESSKTNSFFVPVSIASTTLKGDYEKKQPYIRLIEKGQPLSAGPIKSFKEIPVAEQQINTEAANDKTTETKPATFARPGAKPKETSTKDVNEKINEKDTSTHHIGEKSEGVPIGTFGLFTPIGKEEMTNFLNASYFPKALDRNNQEIGHPEQNKELEVPSFAKQLNHPQVKDLGATVDWPPEVIQKMPRDLLEKFAWDWREDSKKIRQVNLALRAKIAKLEGKADTTGEADVTGTGVMKEEPAPVKKQATFARPGRAA